jgi:bacteriophage N4 adsorption protein B
MEITEFGYYIWLSFRVLFIGLVVLYAVSGLDDLLLDLTYYVRAAFRALFRRRVIKPLTVDQLNAEPEKRIVIVVPAWDESNVIARMLLNTCSSALYRNFHIFVGTYPNDEATKLEVEKIREIFPNIEVVVNPENGPTNKADCLNWLYQGVLLYEKEHGILFDIFLFHDAEDVIHPLSLKYFNYLIPRFHFVQIPVFPFERAWHDFTTGVYMDEFAENHTKDLRAREILASTIPSAGVGTAVSREAMDYLARTRRNQVFDITSLTEDYLMGFLLKDMPGRKIFLQQSVDRVVRKRRWFSGADVERHVPEPIATREFFPNTFRTAVRQKSRWILGIALQGWAVGWSDSFGLNYCLYRDRKAILTNLLVVLGYVVVLYWAIAHLVGIADPALQMPSLVQRDEVYFDVLLVVLGLFVWRILNRSVSVWRIYGPLQAVLSVPRLLYGNILNFAASCQAISRFIRAKIARQVPAWGKTAHAYPTEEQIRALHRRLGDLLLQRRLITAAQLAQAIERQKQTGGKLGQILVDMGVLWEEDLVSTLAEQRHETAVEIDPYSVPPELLHIVPRPLAERYSVFPIALQGDAVVLATCADDPEAIAKEMSAVLERPIAIRRTSSADIRFAIVCAYDAWDASAASMSDLFLQRLQKEGRITADDLRWALRQQKRTHQTLGEVLRDMGLLTQEELNRELRKP